VKKGERAGSLTTEKQEEKLDPPLGGSIKYFGGRASIDGAKWEKGGVFCREKGKLGVGGTIDHTGRWSLMEGP